MRKNIFLIFLLNFLLFFLSSSFLLFFSLYNVKKSTFCVSPITVFLNIFFLSTLPSIRSFCTHFCKLLENFSLLEIKFLLIFHQYIILWQSERQEVYSSFMISIFG
uniref:Uncharacterized protein n=1 Tax=Lutzomyia longipalpis TaxID=7200 RepID=A0A7G3B7D1_LUTLO